MLSAALILLTLQPAADPAGWPQWRGPGRDARVAGPLPADITESALKGQWRVPLGPSYSGPVVAGESVFVTETADAAREVVRALDRRTGRELWRAEWDGAIKVPFFAAANGDWIRSTPAADGESLYVAGMRDVLVCLDAGTGKERWRADFPERFKAEVPAFGFVSSPLVDGDAVYVQAAGSLIKLDKATGEVRWRALQEENAMTGNPFASPVIAELAGRRQLLAQTRSVLAGVDPESGQVLWQVPVPAFRGTNILTPTVVGDRVFTSSYGGGSFLFEIKPSGDGLAAEPVWKSPRQGYMSSPVVIGGHIYLHMRNQRFTCLDLATGEDKWVSEPFGKYWSLVTDGQRILALDQKGELLLIDPSPEEFRLIGRRKVSDSETWAHLAVAGGQLFVRELDGLRAFSHR